MSGPRKFVVDGQEYRWLRRRRNDSPWFRAWIDGLERAALRINFEQPDASPDFRQFINEYAAAYVGSGVRTYNLDSPAVAACLIREAHRLGWDPRGPAPLLLDGFALLRERGFEIAHTPIGNPWLELAATLLECHAAAADNRPPLAWLRAHTRRSWVEVTHEGSPYEPALALAGAIELGIWLERRDNRTAAQLAELAVWADARQHHG